MADNEQEPSTSKEKTKGKGKRAKHLCPVCHHKVINLSRHLKNVHSWAADRAREAVSTFDLRSKAKKTPCPVVSCPSSIVDTLHHLVKVHNMNREEAEHVIENDKGIKDKSSVQKPRKREYTRRVCPIKGCNAVVRRLHNHLNVKHKLNRANPLYFSYLKDARFEELNPDKEGILSINSSSISSTPTTSESETDTLIHKATSKKAKSVMKHRYISSNEISSESEVVPSIWKTYSKVKSVMRHDHATSEETSIEYEHFVPKKAPKSPEGEDKEMSSSYEDRCSDEIIPPSIDERPGYVKKVIKSILGSQECSLHRRPQKQLVGEVYSNVLWDKSATPLKIAENQECVERRKTVTGSSDFSADEVSLPKKKLRVVACDGFYAETSDSCESDDVYEPNNESEEDEDEDDEDDEKLDDEDLQIAKSQDAATGNSTTENILKDFENWLQGIDGGRRELRTAKQYASQISTIIDYVDPIYRQVDSILNMKTLRDKWLSEFEKIKKPGTCKSYLGSLSRFLRFLTVENPIPLSKKKLSAGDVRGQVQEWINAFKTPLAERRWEKLVEDLDKLIKPEDIQNFDKSSHSRLAVSILGRHMEKNGPKSPTKTDYCLVRDYLSTRICIENACRAGPIASMTLGELKKARQENEQMIVTVMKNKNLAARGPATIVLSPLVMKWIKAFVTHMRNHLYGATEGDNDSVFISWSAKQMTSSMISGQINSCWQKSMGKNIDRVCAASFRKAAVTVVHENHPHLKNDLADLMSHHTKTAEKYYAIRQRNKNAAKTSEALRSIMYTPQISNEEKKRDTTQNDYEDLVTGNQTTQEQDLEPQETAEDIESNRHRWTSEEIRAIQTDFKLNIASKKINIGTVREKIKDHPILREIEASKVLDKIRSLMRESSQKLSDSALELPTDNETQEDRVNRLFESDNDSIILSGVSKKGGLTFSDDQTEIYWRLFRDLIESNKQITRKYVMDKIQEDDEARESIVGFTPQQLCDKIRTERRKIARASMKKEKRS